MNTWNDLPGESRWLGLPDMRAMARDFLGFIGTRRHYGDLSKHRVLHERAIDIFDPELARQFLIDHHDAMIRYERGTEVFSQSSGQSVLVTEGVTWQRQRRMLHAAFTPRAVSGYAGLMVDATRQTLDRIRAGLTDMDALFTGLTMDVILRTLFSASAAQDSQAAAEAMQTLTHLGLREMFWPFSPPAWLPTEHNRRKRAALRTLDDLITRHIEMRRQSPAPNANDVLAMLLALRDEADGAALHPTEVRDQCAVTFQAGHETTASALLWWSAMMAAYPHAQQRARDEVTAVLAGRTPTADATAQLPWLTATLKETLRLYPSIPLLMTRRTTADIEFAGYRVPRRTLVRIAPWYLQRDERHFDAPEEFRPERFLPGAAPIPRGAWMPFGVGPRVCLGQHFAMLEMTIIAAMLLQRFVLSIDRPVSLNPVFHISLRPEGGLRLMLEPTSQCRGAADATMRVGTSQAIP